MVVVSLNLLVLAGIFVFLEGLSSTVLFFGEMFASKPVAERIHTKYDTELGWANLPNVHVKDMYGPGKYLKTNSRGFRNDQEFEPKIPEGKIRIICSGDSFTMGYGVGNDNTWCQQLAFVDGRIESANMGQGGYGVDQSYLWYKRDGRKLDHDIHVFAFITIDFLRMQSDRFLGYGKPVLDEKEGSLIVKGIPVPERSFFTVWLLKNQWKIRQLNTMKLLSGLTAVRLRTE